MEMSFENKRPITGGASDSKRFLAEKEGKEYFIKEYQDPEQMRREYTNQKFLYQISQGRDSGFKFLEPEKKGDILYYPALGDEYRWLASGANFEDEAEDPQEYAGAMLQFCKFCHKIDFEDLPEAIKDRHEQKGNQHYLDNFDEDSGYLQEQNLLSSSEVNNLRKVLEKNVDERAFQHHDVVPWHMAKNEETGEIVLVDAEWSDWSLWAYDIAYYMLQMVGYVDQAEDAKKVYEKVKQEYSDRDDFERLLHCALAYRGTRLAAELHRADEKENLKKVIHIIKQETF